MSREKSAKKLSVAKALQELNRLKRADNDANLDDTKITEIYTKESTANNLLEREPTSDTLNLDAETGFGFNTTKHSKEEIDSKIENASLKVETKIKDDIHSIKDKCSSISLWISLSVSGIISAILIAVMIYMNNGLKNDISILKKDVMTKIGALNNAIENIGNKIVNDVPHKDIVSNPIEKKNNDK